MFRKLVDLGYTDEEKAEKFPGMTPEATPQYPPGLCISLDECTLQKLGLEDANPELDDIIDLRAFGKVTAVRKEARSGEEARQCVEIQLTSATVEDEDDEEPGEDDDD